MEEDWMPYSDEPDAPKEQLVPFVPSTNYTAEKVVEFLKLNRRDKLIDLGCGDGRILFKAVEMTSCKGIGIDINTNLIEECKAKVEKENLGDKSINDNDNSVNISKDMPYVTPHLNPND